MIAGRTRIRWKVMFAVFLIATVSYLDRTNLSVAAPVLRQELQLSPTQLGLVLSAFSWSYAIAQIPAGLVAAWLRPRLTYLVALWLWCILLALTTLATSFAGLVLFRIPFGLAEAVTWPAASVLLSRWFPRIEYSQAMSLQNLGLVIGAAVAPPMVAFLITFWGWQLAFIRHDQAQEDLGDAPKGLFPLLLRRPSLWAVGMANFGLDFINFMFLTWYPTYLVDQYHMSLKQMGVMAMEPYIFALFTVLGAGRLVRALTDGGMDSGSARRRVIFGGLLIGTAALVVAVNISDLYGSVTAMSLGYAFVMSILGPMWSIPAEISGRKGAGFAAGFVNFVGNVGGIGSPILMGVVFQHFHSFTPAILIAAGITLVCGVLFILLYRAQADKEAVTAFL